MFDFKISSEVKLVVQTVHIVITKYISYYWVWRPMGTFHITSKLQM